MPIHRGQWVAIDMLECLIFIYMIKFTLCFVWWELIFGKYFWHSWVIGMTKNVGQPEIVFPVNYKINTLIMKIGLRFYFPFQSKLINRIFTPYSLLFSVCHPTTTPHLFSTSSVQPQLAVPDHKYIVHFFGNFFFFFFNWISY